MGKAVGHHLQLADKRLDPFEHRVDLGAEPVEPIAAAVERGPRLERSGADPVGGLGKRAQPRPDQAAALSR